MKKTMMLSLLVGSFMMAIPVSYSGEPAKMSDTVHRKSMSGLHHPDKAHDATMDEKRTTMSDSVHRKTMSGLHHSTQDENAKEGRGQSSKKAVMSDAVHRKTMNGLHHPNK